MALVLKNVQALYPARTCTPWMGYHHRLKWPVTDGTTSNSLRDRLALTVSSPSLYLARSLTMLMRPAAVVSRLTANRLTMYISWPHPRNAPYIRWDRVFV